MRRILRVKPIAANAAVRLQRHIQLHGALHDFLHARQHRVGLCLGALHQQFVVNLQN